MKLNSGCRSAQPAIICRNVCVAYNRADVIHDVCLEIPRGAFLPFVGANGAGKTTLLRAMIGLLRPRVGCISRPEYDGPVGYVPQQKMLDPLFPVSVRQIVTMGVFGELGFWRRPDGSVGERINSVLKRFNLTEHQHKTFRELSGGMRQKVMLARALVSNAALLVMDEPTSELDEESELTVLQELHKLSTELGKTVLIAHHGIDKIRDYTDTICSMEHGRAIICRIDQVTGNRYG